VKNLRRFVGYQLTLTGVLSPAGASLSTPLFACSYLIARNLQTQKSHPK
jgi:hypothetical protein